MKLAFFSNFLNHHQLPICQKFNSTEGVEFIFVACEKIPQDRLKMGYEDINTKYSFVVRAYEDEQVAYQIAEEFDVVIFGACDTKYISSRMRKNKLSFRFCERSLKKGTWRRFIPKTRKKIYEGYTKYKNQPLYILGCGSYASQDLALCGFDINKCFKWGYFPQIEEKNVQALFELKNKNKAPEILYAGRLLPLKHVMDTVKAVHNLKKQNIAVHFTIIGDGECRDKIEQYIDKNKLENEITILPFMSTEEVRTHMDKADIFVFGSSFYEGWGAVMNEAMNSACAVVVSHAVGSASYLIESGKNGYIYKFSDVFELTNKLKTLVLDKELRQSFGSEAYKTISSKWSADVATERFLELCKVIQNGNDTSKLYETGPCSRSNK